MLYQNNDLMNYAMKEADSYKKKFSCNCKRSANTRFLESYIKSVNHTFNAKYYQLPFDIRIKSREWLENELRLYYGLPELKFTSQVKLDLFMSLKN